MSEKNFLKQKKSNLKKWKRLWTTWSCVKNSPNNKLDLMKTYFTKAIFSAIIIGLQSNKGNNCICYCIFISKKNFPAYIWWSDVKEERAFVNFQKLLPTNSCETINKRVIRFLSFHLECSIDVRSRPHILRCALCLETYFAVATVYVF